MSRPTLYILGGGPAGLGVAYHAARRGIPIRLFEQAGEVGGNARTIEVDRFRFDTGAHRLHDKVPSVTAELKMLLGDDLRQIDVPSAILESGGFRKFPLEPVDLIRGLGLKEVIRSGLSLMAARLRSGPDLETFRDVAISRFGKRIAERYLLGYSEKLWGRSSETLSPLISGGRLNGLDFRAMLRELLSRGPDKRSRHLDGSFYYPTEGIGMIPKALAASIPEGSIHLKRGIRRIFHDGSRITKLLTDSEEISLDHESIVVSTLPLPLVYRIVSPNLPGGEKLREGVEALEFRTLRLLFYGLQRERLSPWASIYFPEREVPFTRLYESKNRSEAMAPPGKTGVVLESPTDTAQPGNSNEREMLEKSAHSLLLERFGVDADEIVARRYLELPYAYPILTVEAVRLLDGLRQRIEAFDNLHLIGRNQTFRYQHLHDLLAEGERLVRSLGNVQE